MKENLTYYLKNTTSVLVTVLFLVISFTPKIAQAKSLTLENTNDSQQQTTINVRGTVVDGSGLGLPGATVRLVSSQTVGTVTDNNGNYELSNVPYNGELSFSFVGFITVIENIENRNVINVTLYEDSETLDDVIVVAYGIQKKATLTGAVAAISTKEIKQSPTANMAVTLTGRLPGLFAQQRSGEPGRDETLLFMRGRGTINGQAPLILVDGVERELTSIDPNEVDNVSILKDASSTALFGVRGANGVILVTTRRGTEETPSISLNVESGRQTFTRWPTVLHAYDWALLKNEAWHNDNPNPEANQFPPYSNFALERYKMNDWPEVYGNHDWVNELMQKWVPQTRYNLTLNGKGANVGYFINVGFLDQGGQWKIDPEPKTYDPKNYMKRYNFRTNIDAHLNKSKTLRAFLNAAGYYEQVNGPYVDGRFNNTNATTEILARILTRWPTIVPGPLTPEGEVLIGSGSYQESPWAQINRTGYRKETRSSVIATFGMEQDFTKWIEGLSAAIRVSFDSRSVHFMNGARQYQYWEQVIDPNLVGKDGRDSVYYRRIRPDFDNTPISTSISSNFQSFFDVQLQANYNRIFNNVHNLSGLVLAKQQGLIMPNDPLPFNIRELATRWVYSYDNRYILEFNSNYSGSEQFAPENRYGFFPAFSGAWILSNENFFSRMKDKVHNFKLRGSYGTVGNDKIGGRRFLYLDDVSRGWNGYSDNLGRDQRIIENFFGNPRVQWETATKVNLGFDLGLFKSLNFTFDAFDERRNNILVYKQTIPNLIGVPSSSIAPFNIGKIKNKGYEIEATYTKSINKDLFLIAKGNFSYNDNEIIFIDELKMDSTYAYPYRQTGYQIGQQWGYNVLGFFNNQEDIDNYGVTYQGRAPRPGDFKYEDLNGDNLIDEKDLMPVGYSNVPKYSWGAAFNVTYKNFDISVLFQGAFKVSGVIGGQGPWEWYDFRSFHKNAWTHERASSGEEITYPALSLATSASTMSNTFFNQDRSFIRLKNLEIGYKLPQKWSSLIQAKSVRLYTNGFNLITWDKLKFKDWDPELMSNQSYPVLKIINFGVNVTF